VKPLDPRVFLAARAHRSFVGGGAPPGGTIMRKLIRKVAILAALGLAAPTWAQTATGEAKDAQDTATEKKAETKRAARNKKPGGETAKDQAKDAQDATTAKTAKAKKKGRKAARKTKKPASDTTKKTDASKDATQSGDTGGTTAPK